MIQLTLISPSAAPDPVIQLSATEIVSAATVGIMRRVKAVRDGQKSDISHENDPGLWGHDIEGALVEQALAKHFNAYWDPPMQKGPTGDVAGREARGTWYDTGCLTFRPPPFGTDSENATYWLLTGVNGLYTVRGWVHGTKIVENAELRNHGKNRKPCYFLDQRFLTKPWRE